MFEQPPETVEPFGLRKIELRLRILAKIGKTGPLDKSAPQLYAVPYVLVLILKFCISADKTPFIQ